MLNNHKVGLALGGFAAFVHIVWGALVALGLAQSLIDFIYYMHMIQVPVVVLPFSLSLAVGLVILTGIVGYVVGYIFATIYNWAHK
ncbi:MAG: hypothetical protein HY225_03715 [Candidatus Vogelbacteria bacterium]|nr:hypothetical protein [Candidatus Vogelbacteria bacterium]